MGSEVNSIQNGGEMLTSSIRRVHGVRTKVGRLRKHGVLKSDWFSVKLVILTCRKDRFMLLMPNAGKYKWLPQVIRMFIK